MGCAFWTMQHMHLISAPQLSEGLLSLVSVSGLREQTKITCDIRSVAMRDLFTCEGCQKLTIKHWHIFFLQFNFAENASQKNKRHQIFNKKGLTLKLSSMKSWQKAKIMKQRKMLQGAWVAQQNKGGQNRSGLLSVTRGDVCEQVTSSLLWHDAEGPLSPLCAHLLQEVLTHWLPIAKYKN